MAPDTERKHEDAAIALLKQTNDLKRAEAELDVIRGLVDAAITECQLGSLVAAHFGRTLPDTEDE